MKGLSINDLAVGCWFCFFWFCFLNFREDVLVHSVMKIFVGKISIIHNSLSTPILKRFI